MVNPTMIGALEPRGVALELGTDPGAAMAATVEHQMHLAVGMAAHDHRLAAQGRGDVIAGIRHLAIMADDQPRAREYALHLELEHLGTGIEIAMHPVGSNQVT